MVHHSQSIDTRVAHGDHGVLTRPMQERTGSYTDNPTGTGEAHKQQSKIKQMLCAREARDRGKQKQISERLDHLMQEL
jgi:hypothetical protein